jgi:hypothetical protein
MRRVSGFGIKESFPGADRIVGAQNDCAEEIRNPEESALSPAAQLLPRSLHLMIEI